MSPAAAVTITFLALFVVAAIAFSRWYFSEKQQVKRALRAAPRVDVGKLGEGQLARVTGEVEEHEGNVLRAPISGRPCVAFDVTVEEYRSSGKSGSWHTVIHEGETVPFVVRDGTGRAIVRRSFVRVAIEVDDEKRSGFLNDASPELEAFLSRHGRSSAGWVFNKTLRYREGVFEVGETVTVLGRARLEDDPSPDAAGHGYRDRPRRVVLEPPPDAPMLLSDDF
ncbi:MAG: hypothetical protein IT379_25545 [Deltaproteobacteria bacterium]|nr:hypothetical protein [Deltaproteobacteria bacterium]